MKKIFLILFIGCVALGAKSQIITVAPIADSIVKCYPNPASDDITFEKVASGYNKINLQVYNIFGTLVAELPFINSTITLSVKNYNRGVYIYRIRALNGAVLQTSKFQVSR